MRSFDSLTEQEILALSITSEEEDSRIYGDFVQSLRENYPASADIFRRMQAEEIEHRKRLYERYRSKYGEHLPLIRRQDVRGFIQRRPVWLSKPLSLDMIRRTAESMEAETRRFYLRAAARSTDASTRELLTELAEAEGGHATIAERLENEISPDAAS